MSKIIVYYLTACPEVILNHLIQQQYSYTCTVLYLMNNMYFLSVYSCM